LPDNIKKFFQNQQVKGKFSEVLLEYTQKNERIQIWQVKYFVIIFVLRSNFNLFNFLLFNRKMPIYSKV
jgi:hypothetical protein